MSMALEGSWLALLPAAGPVLTCSRKQGLLHVTVGRPRLYKVERDSQFQLYHLLPILSLVVAANSLFSVLFRKCNVQIHF